MPNRHCAARRAVAYAGALMLALASESAVGAVVINRLAITLVEALLLGAAAVVVRNRRHSYPAAE